MWPLADLAAHWSLLALVVAAAPSDAGRAAAAGRGTPRADPGPAHPARRRWMPSCAWWSNPCPPSLVVTVVAVGTLTTGVVSLAARSDVARVVIQLLVLLSGFVLWAPVLTELPGSQASFRRRTWGVPDRAVHRAELSLGGVDLRPSAAVRLLRPPPHGAGHVAGARPAAGGLPGQAVHHRGALDRGLLAHDAVHADGRAPEKIPNPCGGPTSSGRSNGRTDAPAPRGGHRSTCRRTPCLPERSATRPPVIRRHERADPPGAAAERDAGLRPARLP